MVYSCLQTIGLAIELESDTKLKKLKDKSERANLTSSNLKELNQVLSDLVSQKLESLKSSANNGLTRV